MLIFFQETVVIGSNFFLSRPDIITPNGLNVKRDLHEFQNLHAKSKVGTRYWYSYSFVAIMDILLYCIIWQFNHVLLVGFGYRTYLRHSGSGRIRVFSPIWIRT